MNAENSETWICLVLGLLILLATSGCTTKASANAQAQAAFMRGQQEALKQQQQNAPSVYFRGDVKKPSVPWTEDLTLAQALVAAEYTGLWDPHTILIIRKGETFKIDPKRVLRGVEDPLLEPGDIVEIQR
jgi:hypothetical protein